MIFPDTEKIQKFLYEESHVTFRVFVLCKLHSSWQHLLLEKHCFTCFEFTFDDLSMSEEE